MTVPRLEHTAWLSAAFLTLFLAGIAYGQGGKGEFGSKRDADASAPKVSVKLITSTPALIPGAESQIGLLFTIRDGWHTYAPTQNDTGTPARIDWTLTGFEGAADIVISDLHWPAGARYTQPGQILDHVYEHGVLAVATVRVPADTPLGGVLTIRGELEWLVCDSERCLPEYDSVDLELPIASAARGPGSPEWAAAHATWERERGAVLTGGARDDVTVRWDGSSLIVSSPHNARISFIPIDGGLPAKNLYETGTGDDLHLRIGFERPERASRVMAWIRLQPLKNPESGEGRTWTSDVWMLDTAFGQPPPRVFGEPIAPPTSRGG